MVWLFLTSRLTQPGATQRFPPEAHRVWGTPQLIPAIAPPRPRVSLDLSLLNPSPTEGRLGSPVCFVSFAAKSFIVFLLGPGLEEAPGWLKGCPVAAGRGSGRSQTPGGAGGPSKASELHRLSVMLEGEPFEDTPAQPSRGTPSLGAEPGVTHLPGELHLLTQEAALQEVAELRTVQAEPRPAGL